MSTDDMAWDELHPATQKILSRRGFLGTAGKGAAAVSFLGMTFSVLGCSSDDTATTGTGAGSTTTTGAAAATTTAAAADSLYARLGGEPAITAVVDLFVANVVADEVINARFAATDAPKFKALLVEQIGEATGGPQKYTGKNMKDAHEGMGITVAEFNALVGDLVKALDTAEVPKPLQDELLTPLAAMQPDIVEA